MTIVAGFNCKDGVVLCSDTQLTQAGGKSYESKIFRIKESSDCHLAYAGYAEFIKEFVAEIRTVVAHEETHRLIPLIKSHYKRFHHKHYTQAPKAERVFAQIIVAVREGKKIGLYAGNGRSFYPVENRICFGTGAPIAEPFFSRTDFSKLYSDQAVRLAIYTLWKIKEFAEGVGGQTKLLSIENEGMFDPPIPSDYDWMDSYIEDIEKAYKILDKEMHPLLLDFPVLTPERITKMCRSITKELKKFRANQMKEHDKQIRKSIGQTSPIQSI